MVALPFVDSGFVRGLLTGSAFTAVVGSLAFWVVQVTGTASVMMGDLGEQWTASELRKLRRDGWHLVNHVRLRVWDIDHVLVGPGGVLAVETKWSATKWRFHPVDDRIRAAANQARENAKSLSLWTDLRSLGVGEVEAVVFLWGAGTRDIPADIAVQFQASTTIVAGPHAELWRSQLHTQVLSPEQVQSAWKVLDARCSATDPVDQARQPLPPSLAELAVRLVIAVAAGTAGFLVEGLAASGLGASGWWQAACVGLLLPGLALHRLGHARYAAWGWLLGAGTMVVLTVLLVARDAVM
jgi:hypothetical protein